MIRSAIRLGGGAPIKASTKHIGRDLPPKIDPSTLGEFAPNEGNESMMPWKGWFSKGLKKAMGDVNYEKLRRVALFKPDDLHDLEGVPTSARLTMPGVDRIKGYRYPSPGARPVATIPKEPIGTDPYNTNYYSRDTRRNPNTKLSFNIVRKEDVPLLLSQNPNIEIFGDANDETVMVNALEPVAGIGSPGNKGVFATGPSSFDPSGLRAAMSTNHAAMQASLELHAPTQLPKYEWEDRQDELLASWKAKGLPPMPGVKPGWMMPKGSRVASW